MKPLLLHARLLAAIIAGLIFLILLIAERDWFILGFLLGSVALGGAVATLVRHLQGRVPVGMADDGRRPEISMHRIPVGGGFAGLIFAVGSCLVFLIGIPALRWFLLGAVGVGSVVAGLLWRWHKNRPVEITDIHGANG